MSVITHGVRSFYRLMAGPRAGHPEEVCRKKLDGRVKPGHEGERDSAAEENPLERMML